LYTFKDDPIYRPRRFAYIDELSVAKRYRGQGLGRALMDAAHKFVLSQGIDEVELDVWERNAGAIAFYEKLGYAKLRLKMQFVLSEE
jgi:ribosomal protein S18 acetylase RimI-like enzyme